MDNDVSVTALLEREGWGERARTPGQSRWRVVAVMLAVVVGCGVAAVLVAFSGHSDPQADEINQVSVLPMPLKTSGYGGADESPDPETQRGGVGGGSGETTDESPGGHRHHQAPPPVTTTTSVVTSVVPTSDGPAPTDPPGTATPTGPGGGRPTTTEQPPCLLWPLIC